MALAVGVALAGPAHADDGSDAIENALERLPSEYGVLRDEAHATRTVKFNIPNDPSVGVTLVTRHGELQVALPFASRAADGVEVQSSALAYDNRNGSVTVPVGKKDGSVQITTVLETPSAPTSFPYEISVEGLHRIEVTDDGAAMFIAGDGSFLGGASAPWAVDAAGNAVPTRYEVSGATLTQVVDHAADGYIYPIVADPWLGAALYYNAYVTWESKGHKVNTQPTPWGVNNALPQQWWAHISEVKSRLGANASKYNASILQQHYCHLVGLPYSLPVFNLESWRPVMSYPSQAPYRCNYPEGYYH